jgi:hypothetical protein
MNNVMNNELRHVGSVAELLAAVESKVGNIEVNGQLQNVPTLRLQAGQVLTGADQKSSIQFASGQDGLQLTTDNSVGNLQLVADPDRRAIFNDTSVAGLGRLLLQRLEVTGVVQILASDKVRSGHVDAHDVDIVAADARAYDVRPKGYGVEVIPGAFTLWNQQTDAAVAITADLTGLSAGRAGAPVRGSGIFVSGAGDVGGRLNVRRLETGDVYSDGGIAQGTPDRITGGVFTVYGAYVDTVHNHGPVTTYGPNDMVLDNWGTVGSWVADDKITSHGPSGIGFVNFGTLNELEINAPIETFGQGARGFNVYSGAVQSATFERVVTHADGAVGVQVSQPVGSIEVRRGIETYGGTGDSLVKGKVVTLSAIALSIKPGGSVRELKVAGGLTTHGKGVEPLELHGNIDTFSVSGGFVAAGGGFDTI